MFKFTGSSLFLKGTATAYLQDTSTNNIVYASDKFQTANITTSVTQGEVRGGIGNPILIMIPSDSSLQVNFVAADFSMVAKAGQLGARLSYGAPVMVCQTVTASGATLSIDVSDGAPVAAPGASDVVAFVQQVGAASPVETGGIAYPIDATTGAITGFAATSGTTYKVWYHINRANAQIATVSSLFEPNVYRFTAVMAVYDSKGATGGNQGTHVGNLIVVVPRLKLGGDAGGVNGDQTGNDTTSITGQALAYDPDTISGECGDCSGGGNPLAYYIYVPCDTTTGVEGVVSQLGGVVTVAASSSVQMTPALVVNGNLVRNIDPSAFTYALTGAPEGTSVSTSGVVTAGAAAGDGEITVTYSTGGQTWTDTANISVIS